MANGQNLTHSLFLRVKCGLEHSQDSIVHKLHLHNNSRVEYGSQSLKDLLSVSL